MNRNHNMAAPSPTPSYPLATLYIGDLHPDLNEAMLFGKLRPIGSLLSIRVCRDKHTRKSLGYAYVTFQNIADAERAIDTMNYENLKGKPIRLMWLQRDPAVRPAGLGNIFIRNLDKSTDNACIYELFSRFGQILSCTVARDQTGQSKGYAFVHFGSDQAAQSAIDTVNGAILKGKKLVVDRFVSCNEVEREHAFTNVFIKNFGDYVDDKKLQKLFQTFGTITASKVMTDEDGKSKGFGFVRFQEPESAEKAVKELNGKKIKGRALFLGRARKLPEREVDLRLKFATIRQASQRRFVLGTNLYVKNLDEKFDDEVLKYVFDKFGKVVGAKVMRDTNSRSRAFGFVSFSTPEEANKAAAYMNGKLFACKVLYVAVVQRKEERKQLIAAQMNRFPAQASRLPLYPGAAFGGLPFFRQMQRANGCLRPMQLGMMRPPRQQPGETVSVNQQQHGQPHARMPLSAPVEQTGQPGIQHLLGDTMTGKLTGKPQPHADGLGFVSSQSPESAEKVSKPESQPNQAAPRLSVSATHSNSHLPKASSQQLAASSSLRSSGLPNNVLPPGCSSGTNVFRATSRSSGSVPKSFPSTRFNYEHHSITNTQASSSNALSMNKPRASTLLPSAKHNAFTNAAARQTVQPAASNVHQPIHGLPSHHTSSGQKPSAICTLPTLSQSAVGDAGTTWVVQRTTRSTNHVVAQATLNAYQPISNNCAAHERAQRPNFTATKLFVANFGKEMDGIRLWGMFEPFGEIISANIVKDNNGVSKGFGFVRFQRSADAQKKQAITALNGKCVGAGKRKLHVDRAKTGEEKERDASSTGQASVSHRPNSVRAGNQAWSGSVGHLGKNQMSIQKPPTTESANKVTTDNDRKGLVCAVCYDRPVEVILRPCNHISFCKDCTLGIKACHMCRKPVESVEVVFINGAFA